MNTGERITGKVLSVNISFQKGVRKKPVEEIELVENFGVKNDAHAGNWHRQVSMLSVKSIEKAKSWGIQVGYGDFAENITVDVPDIWRFPVGTKVYINECVLEITQVGKECHEKCVIAKSVGRCVMPIEGIFLRVLKGGKVKKGDNVVFEI
ncbi:MOSC domain-containing protein [Pseudothermotoga thermarum]|uniref:MOSC domain containing protein n=1 Tax=Pseudothermotoga thermarum DSM 5069 TaxID=688269 RepID=F7YXI5_9THEM|nr:MOSC domain-containing protein [Pseudothermotoga thermarum]AEH50626.1 MOSC domain containing protein [Pseudothermotoga thermarum DSM 5069]